MTTPRTSYTFREGLTIMAAKAAGIDPDLAVEAGDSATAVLNPIRNAMKAKSPKAMAQHVTQAQQALRSISPRQHPQLVSALQAKLLALQGRGGDTEIAHVTPGEVVVPRNLQTPAVMRTLAAEAERAGIDPRRYTIGHRANSVNPRTGAEEFGEIEEVVVTDRREFHPGWGGPEIGYQPDDPWRTGPGEGGIGGGVGNGLGNPQDNPPIIDNPDAPELKRQTEGKTLDELIKMRDEVARAAIHVGPTVPVINLASDLAVRYSPELRLATVAIRVGVTTIAASLAALLGAIQISIWQQQQMIQDPTDPV
ncbi:MAG: hypothetical protein SFV19_06610 [Rhodospirillaceae bacterium]|nr:hypothetical protein [Rhodospirillaceae bacterium]